MPKDNKTKRKDYCVVCEETRTHIRRHLQRAHRIETRQLQVVLGAMARSTTEEEVKARLMESDPEGCKVATSPDFGDWYQRALAAKQALRDRVAVVRQKAAEDLEVDEYLDAFSREERVGVRNRNTLKDNLRFTRILMTKASTKKIVNALDEEIIRHKIVDDENLKPNTKVSVLHVHGIRKAFLQSYTHALLSTGQILDDSEEKRAVPRDGL